ncbi:uncharacterized protein LOC122510072 [Leptopilina heterotoma]|uniref:uncharacterized protein LOC122510072 n=1 Tax=Leptopilina heterotoma TaxID=63436 RepID=UPI001CA81252|nr:uncharacterized protein LOC122510072 [Leptopilina heterotoma]
MLFKTIFHIVIFFIVFDLNYSYYQNCPKNMKIFTEEDEYEYEEFCDCEDNLLYNPADGNCYDPYREGPCSIGYYFALLPGEISAKCIENPCRIDGLVPYNGQCYNLWRYGHPCSNNNTYLGISENFQIQCDNSKYLGTIDNQNSSKICPQNAYLHSSHYPSNYLCRCRNNFIFSNGSCYEPYRQGPCHLGSYLIFTPGEGHPKCEANPCESDGIVPFEGGCYKINKYGHPCTPYFYKLTVTKGTFELKCISTSLTEYKKMITAPGKICRPGSKRVLLLGCKHVFQ